MYADIIQLQIQLCHYLVYYDITTVTHAISCHSFPMDGKSSLAKYNSSRWGFHMSVSDNMMSFTGLHLGASLYLGSVLPFFIVTVICCNY